jgi:hypothetical protein
VDKPTIFDGYKAYWLSKAAIVVFYYTTLAEVNGTRINFSAETNSYSSKGGQTTIAPLA